MSIIPLVHMGSRCTWSEGVVVVFFSRDFAREISRNCFIFQCIIYMHSLALHNNVMGALGFVSRVCKGVERTQVKQAD